MRAFVLPLLLALVAGCKPEEIKDTQDSVPQDYDLESTGGCRELLKNRFVDSVAVEGLLDQNLGGE